MSQLQPDTPPGTVATLPGGSATHPRGACSKEEAVGGATIAFPGAVLEDVPQKAGQNATRQEPGEGRIHKRREQDGMEELSYSESLAMPSV